MGQAYRATHAILLIAMAVGGSCNITASDAVTQAIGTSSTLGPFDLRVEDPSHEDAFRGWVNGVDITKVSLLTYAQGPTHVRASL
jgi:hypothetical protein